MKWLSIAWIVFVVAVYSPDVGRGFIKDDFTWIRAAQAAIAAPVTLIRQRDAGFYRPLVTLSFAIDYAAHGWHPRGYGWTNLALYVLCTIAVALLTLALGLSPGTALLAALPDARRPASRGGPRLTADPERDRTRSTHVAPNRCGRAARRSGRPVFREAFGDLASEAMRTRFGREWDVPIEDGSHPSADRGGVIADYWIRRGTLSRARP